LFYYYAGIKFRACVMPEKHSNDMFRISMVSVYFESFELTNEPCITWTSSATFVSDNFI